MATNNATNTSNPVTVAQGGSGVSTLTTAYGVLTAGTTATGNIQTLSALGASGTVLTSNGAAALPSFQAAPAASGVSVGAISGYWYPSGSTFGGTTAAVVSISRATGTLYFHPIFITKTTIFTNIGIMVGDTGVGTSVLGLYNDSGNSAPTGNPITNSNSGSLTNNTNQFSSFTFGSVITLTPGIYWTAHTVSGTGTFIAPSTGGFEIGGRGLGVTGTPTTSNIIAPQAGWSQSFSYGTTLPAIGSLTATNVTGAGDVFLFLQAQ